MTDVRTGIGWDNHRVAAGRPLIIGGLNIESEIGLEGHSDADVLLHALTDAVLGAIAAGDIGEHFPDSDPQWRGAASRRFVLRACELAREGGWQILNADTIVILERPKLKEYRTAMRTSIADLLGVTVDRVSVKFKTSEKVGPVGEGRSAEAHAIVTLGR